MIPAKHVFHLWRNRACIVLGRQSPASVGSLRSASRLCVTCLQGLRCMLFPERDQAARGQGEEDGGGRPAAGSRAGRCAAAAAGTPARGLHRLLHHQRAAIWAAVCGQGRQPARPVALPEGSCAQAQGMLSTHSISAFTAAAGAISVHALLGGIRSLWCACMRMVFTCHTCHARGQNLPGAPVEYECAAICRRTLHNLTFLSGIGQATKACARYCQLAAAQSVACHAGRAGRCQWSGAHGDWRAP